MTTVLKLLAADAKMAVTQEEKGMLTDKDRETMCAAAEVLNRCILDHALLDTYVQLTDAVRRVLGDDLSSPPELGKKLENLLSGKDRVIAALKDRQQELDAELTVLQQFRNDVIIALGYCGTTTNEAIVGSLRNKPNLGGTCSSCTFYRRDIEENEYFFCKWHQKFFEPDFYCKGWGKKK